MKWITAPDLERWAERLDARTRLSELISDLVRASVREISSFRFPTGDSAQLPGYDGSLICSEGSPYVPEGLSVWEFGTDGDYVGKATKDYKTRTASPGTIDRGLNTFVFVTPRTWASKKIGREKWLQERLADSPWKDIRIIDGTSLEDWLGLNEAVASRFAREVLAIVPQKGVRSVDEFWQEYSNRFRPALTENVLLADRDAQSQQLLAQLRGTPLAHPWQGDSTEEVIAFAVAAIRKAEGDVRKFLEARTLIVDTEDAARQITAEGKHGLSSTRRSPSARWCSRTKKPYVSTYWERQSQPSRRRKIAPHARLCVCRGAQNYGIRGGGRKEAGTNLRRECDHISEANTKWVLSKGRVGEGRGPNSRPRGVDWRLERCFRGRPAGCCGGGAGFRLRSL